MTSGHQYSLLNPLMYPGMPGTTAAMMAGTVPAMMAGAPAAVMAGAPAAMMAGPMMHGHGFMYTAEQMMWLQQTYAQYMAQYMQ